MLGDLTVKIGADIAEFQSKMKSVSSTLKNTGRQMRSIGRGLSTAITLPVVGIGAAMIKSASDAEETAAKFGTVFSSIRDEAEKSAAVLTDSFGLSQKASQELLGDTGDLLTGFGFAQDSALELSEEVNKLAVDLASFTNFSGGAEGASRALTKALLGERESVKSLGISILETDVQAKILENTQQGLTFETERQAKAYATLQLAQEQSKNAIGDFARTQDSFANQMRQLRAEVSDLAVSFGNELLPMASDMIESIRNGIAAFSNFSAESRRMILVIGAIAAAIGPVIVGLGILVTTIGALMSPITLVIAGIAGLSAALIYVLDNWEAIKERVSDISWWRNAIIDMIQFWLDYNPFKFIADGYVKLLDLLGVEVQNPFSMASEWLEGLKVETQAYKHQFGSFMDSIRSAMSSVLGLEFGSEVSKQNEQLIKSTRTLNAGLDVQAQKFQQVSVSARGLNKEFERTSAMSAETATVINDTFAQSMSNMIQSFAKGIGEMAVGSKNLKQVGLSLLSVLADMAMQIGTLFITLGTSVAAALNPATLFASLGTSAIGAGAALLAAGAGLRAIVGGLQKFHDGGIVPGVGEVPIMAKGGEMVLNESQQGFLGKMLNTPRQQDINVTVSGRLDGSDIFVSGQRGGINWNR